MEENTAWGFCFDVSYLFHNLHPPHMCPLSRTHARTHTHTHTHSHINTHTHKHTHIHTHSPQTQMNTHTVDTLSLQMAHFKTPGQTKCISSKDLNRLHILMLSCVAG